MESAEAFAVTAPQLKFPPCGPAPLLPHRTGSKTPPPHCLPACRLLLSLRPGKPARSGLHTTSCPSGPQPLRSLEMAGRTPLLTLTSWGRRGGNGASPPPTLNLEAWTHLVSIRAHSWVTSHRFLTTNHLQKCSLPLSSRLLSRISTRL